MLPLFPDTFSHCLYFPGMPFPSSMLFLSRLSNPSCSLTHLTWSSKPVFLDRSSEILTQGWPSALRIFITMFIGWLFSTFRFLRKSSIISICPRTKNGCYLSGKRLGQWGGQRESVMGGWILVKKVPTPKLDPIPCLSAHFFNSKHRSISKLSLKTIVLVFGSTLFSL